MCGSQNNLQLPIFKVIIQTLVSKLLFQWFAWQSWGRNDPLKVLFSAIYFNYLISHEAHTIPLHSHFSVRKHPPSYFDDNNLTASCNVDCLCDDAEFEPVCLNDTLQFYSPCHAGCWDVVEEDRSKVSVHHRYLTDFQCALGIPCEPYVCACESREKTPGFSAEP